MLRKFERILANVSIHVRTRALADVYNDTVKAAPHVSHYDFSALLLIKMQIYRGGRAKARERERESERKRDRETGERERDEKTESEREREGDRKVRRITSGGATTNTGI